jgi:hypothetical protein
LHTNLLHHLGALADETTLHNADRLRLFIYCRTKYRKSRMNLFTRSKRLLELRDVDNRMDQAGSRKG